MKKPILITGLQATGKSQLVDTIKGFARGIKTTYFLGTVSLEVLKSDIRSKQHELYIFEEISSFDQILAIEHFIIDNALTHLERIYINGNDSFDKKIIINSKQIFTEDYFNCISLKRHSFTN